MNRTLFAKELRSNLFVFGIVYAVLVMYIAVVVSMFDPELGKSLDMMMASMPELFAAFGMATQATTLTDFMLNYLYGFLLTMFSFVLIVIMANKLMVRYLDRGTMSYLLATPNSRTRIATTLAGAMVALLALLAMLVTLAEVGCAELMFPGDLDTQGLLRAERRDARALGVPGGNVLPFSLSVCKRERGVVGWAEAPASYSSSCRCCRKRATSWSSWKT